MSPKLEEALRAWLEKPAKGYGLCNHVYMYIKNFLSLGDCTAADTVTDELYDMFESEGLEACAPFNGTEEEYQAECERKACHLNPKRIAWVKATLGV